MLWSDLKYIRMDSIPYTVVGVLAPGTWDRTPANVWIPISLAAAGYGDHRLETHVRGNGAAYAPVVAAGGSELRRVDGVCERGQPAPLTRRDARARNRHPRRARGDARPSRAHGD